MSRFDQAKMLMKAKKIQKELERQVISVEKGDGAVKVEITGDQKLKKVHIDSDSVDTGDIEQLEMWIEEAIRDAFNEARNVQMEKMQPIMGALGDLGL